MWCYNIVDLIQQIIKLKFKKRVLKELTSISPYVSIAWSPRLGKAFFRLGFRVTF